MSLTKDTLDPDTFKPYDDEPMASEEWVFECKKKQETQSDFDRKLEDRYEGIRLENSWSRCLSYASITIVIPFQEVP